MTGATTKLIVRSLFVAGLLIMVVALNHVRGLAPGITFATSGIDLKIDSIGWYNGFKVPSATWSLKNLVPGSDKFFNFNDIKPGDNGCEVISLHVKTKDAWLCMDFRNLSQKENGVNEPESHEDTTAGADLAYGTEFFGWMDDGDGKYEPPLEKPIFGTSSLPRPTGGTRQSASYVFASSTTYAIADARGGGACKINTTRYVGMCWCAGDLTVKNNGKFGCDGTKLGNAAQTDSFSVDVRIRAEAVHNKPYFTCGGYAPVKPPCTNCSAPININITNFASTTNTTTSSSNTGGNTAGSGGNIITGGATSNSSTTNIINRIELRTR